MAGEWRERPLDELTDNFDSVRVPVKEADRRAGPYPYYGASGIVDRIDNYLFDGEYLLIAEDGENLRTRNTPVAFLARGKFWVNNHAHIVRGNGEADTRFLMYALAVADISGYLTGSTMPKLTQGNMNRIPLLAPPADEQRAIAHILGTLDDKIELNRRMNETLERQARALFKSWFVDFDPVRAKAEGRDPGLPKPLADLFPDSFEDSELGEIPKGWRWHELGDLVELTRGTTYKSRLKELPGPVLLGLAAIRRNGGFRDDKLSTYGGDSPAKLVLGPGDLFASLKDVTQAADLLGAVARVPSYVKRGRLTQDTVKLSFRSPGTSRELVYRTLLTDEYRDYCRAHATGTTNLGLSRDDFLAFPVVQPTEAVQRLFDSVEENIESRGSSATAESRILAALRDTLLPKLISGELRVKDPARFLEGVVA
jgi:type I restriction enzyme, S subunit